MKDKTIFAAAVTALALSLFAAFSAVTVAAPGAREALKRVERLEGELDHERLKVKMLLELQGFVVIETEGGKFVARYPEAR